jgi:trehalose 6-phosphate synthase
MPMAMRQQAEVPAELAELLGGRRVIVASNRGPVEFHRAANGHLTTKRGAGGVVTALADLARNLPLTWIAAAMTEGDRLAFPATGEQSDGARAVRLGRQPLRVRYVSVPPEVYALYYDRISNQFLWFLQHYLWDPARWPTFTGDDYHAWEHGYRAVNAAIAEAVIAQVQTPRRASLGPGTRQPSDGAEAIVLLQDYHLYLAAGFIRARLPRATLQQFIHIPWPTIRYWQFLPERFLHEIFAGLTANDVLGFQTERDARNFLVGARELLPDAHLDFDGGRLVQRRRRLLVRAYPITVDANEIHRTLASAAGKLARQELALLLEGSVRSIVRVDRLEPTKNIVRGLLAYDGLLRQHPELRGTVRHLAFLVPSRQGLAQYQRYEREVRRLIRRINREFGTREWQPIVAYFENNRARALAALRCYDVLVVNPIIDGMNLVVKEGAIVNERDGVILLSRTAGAFHQLGEAVLPVSPLDLEELQGQLYAALTMSVAERQQRAARARAIVLEDTLQGWIAGQLRDAAQIRPPRQRVALPGRALQQVG